MNCPACGSSQVRTDGDLVESLCHPDHDAQQSYFYQWNDCDDCGYQWRGNLDGQEVEEPALDVKAGMIAGLVCVAALIILSLILRG